MSQSEKAELYGELKDAGVQFTKHYREYTTDDLKKMVMAHRMHNPPPLPEPEPNPPMPVFEEPVAGAQQYTPGNGETVIRVDENGWEWLQDEVLKPAFPAPRKRRKLTYVDTGAKMETIVNGKYIESFETAGTEVKTGEVKITMPSFQVGIYRDPRFPQFKIHTYNGLRGFDLFDVYKYYGGADLVPPEIKKLYVANDLCFDITTTIRAIRAEFRELSLKGANQ